MEKNSLIAGNRVNNPLNEKGNISNAHSDRVRAVSNLLIQDASPNIDEGTYTCSPSDGTTEASTRLYVLQGEQANCF